nr:MAG TPA: hypothetical protein [Caudoviricetes sp.]
MPYEKKQLLTLSELFPIINSNSPGSVTKTRFSL